MPQPITDPRSRLRGSGGSTSNLLLRVWLAPETPEVAGSCVTPHGVLRDEESPRGQTWNTNTPVCLVMRGMHDWGGMSHPMGDAHQPDGA